MAPLLDLATRAILIFLLWGVIAWCALVAAGVLR